MLALFEEILIGHTVLACLIDISNDLYLLLVYAFVCRAKVLWTTLSKSIDNADHIVSFLIKEWLACKCVSENLANGYEPRV